MILCVYRVFVKTYIDDIVIFNKTLKKHLIYLNKVFQLLNLYNIRLSFKKLYLKYSIVALLKQKINVFNLTIVIDKLTTIFNFQFLIILKNLKTYFDFID